MSFAMIDAPLSDISTEESPQTFFYASTTMDHFFDDTCKVDEKQEAKQLYITGRRTWRTFKGKPEAVWPPALESALLTALKLYPNGLRFQEKISKRFPGRNLFISDFILKQTGKKRTPKQVSSRLQQLRDTCRDKKTLQLISPRSTVENTTADFVPGIAQRIQESPCSSPDLCNSSLHPTSVDPEYESPPKLPVEHHSFDTQPFIPVGQPTFFNPGLIDDRAAWRRGTCGMTEPHSMCCCSFQDINFLTSSATAYHKNSAIRFTADTTYEQTVPSVNAIHHSFLHQRPALDVIPTTRSAPEFYSTSYNSMTSHIVPPSGYTYL